MKKLLIAVLALALVSTCVAALFINASAEDYTYLDLRPVEGGEAEYSATGADVEFKSNGTVVVTLTGTTATLSMVYKTASTINQEAFVNVETAKYVKFFYEKSSESVSVQVHAHYDRGNKNNADLYLTGMTNDASSYLVLSGATYGVWGIYQYLSERAGYLPADNILKFSDITYTITGQVGDTFTLYYFEIADDYDEDFGTVVPDDTSIDLSDIESSEPVTSEESTATSEATSEAPVVESSEDTTPVTGDNGFVALAVVSVIALAGVVVLKRR